MNKQAKILAMAKSQNGLLQSYDLDNPAMWLSASPGAEEAERPPPRAVACRRHHKVTLYLCCWCIYTAQFCYLVSGSRLLQGSGLQVKKKPPKSKFRYI